MQNNFFLASTFLPPSDMMYTSTPKLQERLPKSAHRTVQGACECRVRWRPTQRQNIRTLIKFVSLDHVIQYTLRSTDRLSSPWEEAEACLTSNLKQYINWEEKLVFISLEELRGSPILTRLHVLTNRQRPSQSAPMWQIARQNIKTLANSKRMLITVSASAHAVVWKGLTLYALLL